MNLLTYLNTIFVAASAILSWVFIIRYYQLDWRATDEGKHLMGFTLCVAIFTSLTTAARVLNPPEITGLTPVATLLFGWLTYLLASRNWLLHKAQRDARDKESL